MKHQQKLQFGPQVTDEGVFYRLWAPSIQDVKVTINKQTPLQLNKSNDGWHQLLVKDSKAGDKYKFIIDNDLSVPDPASRQQDKDIHDESLVPVNSFDWQDLAWEGKDWEEAIIYELHVGTFTPKGDFLSIIDKLDHFVELGITAIQLMPIADFPGKRNWGYDGVLLYAPDTSYGTPDDLRQLIQSAHKKGLMVFLDVVYNHFGPDGNYLWCYAQEFFSDKHETPWGQAINLQNKTVREFYIQNTLYWLNEFHFDGLRFDAVHALIDDSDKHFLKELAERVRTETFGRKVHLILENEKNQAKYLERDKQDQPVLYTAQWNDDFHHCLRCLATGENSGYYKNYQENIQDKLLRSLIEGFVFQGEGFDYKTVKLRGEKSDHLPLQSFVNFIQNHDHVGNRAFGERIGADCNSKTLQTLIALYLLCPSIPMLFMGEEWNSNNPFMYFCDFSGDLAEAIREGREKEFSEFPEFADPTERNKIPDPIAEETFIRSKLNWSELKENEHKTFFEIYKTLMRLRKKYIIPFLKDSTGKLKVQAKKISDQEIEVIWINDQSCELIMECTTLVKKLDCNFYIKNKNEFKEQLFSV
ncbi:MAG: malto-oligosyltrehalose trehalohydrolase [Candidatus Caenarcaniphilales bacterium]|nr:malto-oligosyltrehalose trehalohydrolase [Candidatus Caenarcaniphilales bacterium]